MKRAIINPDYENARYELAAMDRHGKRIPDPWPFRYNETPPEGVFGDNPEFAKWQREHYIPPTIIVEELSKCCHAEFGYIGDEITSPGFSEAFKQGKHFWCHKCGQPCEIEKS